MASEKPVFRRLRVFAFDPGMNTQLDTSVINEVTVNIPWEDLQPGPVGEYVAVEDVDIHGTRVNPAVNLDDPHILARDGLPPSDGNPQFHQQMAYATAMRTITHFERALNRPVHWPQNRPEYTRQLILYPHSQEMANAYYHPGQVAIHFGYFKAVDGSPFPGMDVFTCLSQDVVVHQTAHALLDSLIQYDPEPTFLDEPAFLEGFCDLVGLLERFSLPEVLRHQIAATRGDLTGRGLMGLLAQQFSEAIGLKSGGLRGALGELDKDGVWKPRQPNPKDYHTLEEPHARGALLLAAVFDAFNKVYRNSVIDLLRIATEGTGVLPEGQLHPDLVDLIAAEAARAAGQILDMCIRALDYCPPCGITFGDFLRAVVTAFYDLETEHNRKYCIAFIDAFRQYGFFPENVGNLSIDTLRWPQPAGDSPEARVIQDFILEVGKEHSTWSLPTDRADLYAWMQDQIQQLQAHLQSRKGKIRGLGAINPSQPFHVRALIPRLHTGLKGVMRSDWVIQIVQDYTTPAKTKRYQAGTTLIVDSETGLVRYAIYKANPATASRLQAAQKEFIAVSLLPPPQERRLRVFAFDPSAAIKLDTARINQVTLPVVWETLSPGPQGEYVEVVDYDPASECFYSPLNLADPYLLAMDGLPPSQTNPQFHQQMVYAVSQRTIRNFERSLGRLALWSPRFVRISGSKNSLREEYVGQLRIFPHALREANAFYSPEKKAVLFGYFQSSLSEGAAPLTVFTCLSHDIIAHEITHALLDGMHHRFVEPSNPDVLAFHEAFADLVALFQHFSLPEVLQHQIAATRGDLASQNRLGELAQEFGMAIGQHGALRSALGHIDPDTEEWKPHQPDPQEYTREMEPHARGALLVAAVFDAFLILYRARVAPLFRIATRGSGVLPAGHLHPDLVRRVSAEAAHCAQTVLTMCIRALDYCPPVDITFGEYLRAVITADFEFNPVDVENRRVAFIEAFQRHGILPNDVRAFSQEGLLWKQATAFPDEDESFMIDFIKEWTKKIPSWNLTSNRQDLFYLMRGMRVNMHRFLEERMKTQRLSVLVPDYPFEVHSLRPSTRIDWQGKSHYQWIIVLMQRKPESLSGARVKEKKADYFFRGGATLLIDAETGKIRYSIRKRLDSTSRNERQRKYMNEISGGSLHATYFHGVQTNEPFAILHRF